MERLASRLAMIVSDDGEARNAGAAAAHLARRMGLTGGQLKAIVLSGAAHEGAGGPHADALRGAADQATRADRLERETAGLRHSLYQLDVAVRRAQDEASLLRESGDDLQEKLDQANSALRVQQVVGVVVLAAAVIGVVVALVGPRLHPMGFTRGPGGTEQAATASTQVALTRVPAAEMHREPDAASLLIARLPVGSRVVVHRLVWRTLSQWAEVEVGSNTGYVSVNELDMP